MKLTDGVLYKRCHVERSNGTQKQLVMPQGLRGTVMEQFHDYQLSVGLSASQITWTGQDIQRKYGNCTLFQSCITVGKRRIASLQTINVGLKLSKVAADILGLVTLAMTSFAKYILVLTDCFTKFVVCVPCKRLLQKMLVEQLSRTGFSRSMHLTAFTPTKEQISAANNF